MKGVVVGLELRYAAAAVSEFALPGVWGLTPIAGMLGMMVLLYWLLATGRLVTKNSHEREIGLLKEASANLQKTVDKQGEQITSLLSVGRTVQAVLRAAGPDIDEDTAPHGGAG